MADLQVAERPVWVRNGPNHLIGTPPVFTLRSDEADGGRLLLGHFRVLRSSTRPIGVIQPDS